jgi:hypothetical protein
LASQAYSRRSAWPRALAADDVFCIVRRGQFVRDWSEEGQSERNQCYGPILAELERIYPKETTVR